MKKRNPTDRFVQPNNLTPACPWSGFSVKIRKQKPCSDRNMSVFLKSIK